MSVVGRVGAYLMVVGGLWGAIDAGATFVNTERADTFNNASAKTRAKLELNQPVTPQEVKAYLAQQKDAKPEDTDFLADVTMVAFGALAYANRKKDATVPGV